MGGLICATVVAQGCGGGGAPNPGGGAASIVFTPDPSTDAVRVPGLGCGGPLTLPARVKQWCAKAFVSQGVTQIPPNPDGTYTITPGPDVTVELLGMNFDIAVAIVVLTCQIQELSGGLPILAHDHGASATLSAAV